MPPLSLKNSPLLRQAAEVYTLMIFKDEYNYAIAIIIKSQSEDQLVHKYIVALLDEYGEDKVDCDPTNRVISCSC